MPSLIAALRRHAIVAVAALGGAWGIAACDEAGRSAEGEVRAPDASAVAAATESVRAEPIRPIPLFVEVDPQKSELGRRLFHDTQLSSDGSTSCASCHNLNLGGSDRKRRSTGVGGQVGFVNAPTVFNSAFNFKQFWDGRADTLEEQVDGPLLAEHEMDADWATVVSRLDGDPSYATAFATIYTDGVTPDNVREAIAEFERSLSTPNSRFDHYLRGDDAAITDEENAGYVLFKSLGCASCHQGVNAGGNMFEVFGVMADYFTDRGDVTEADLGRYNVTGRDDDRHVFKVPGLRNVTLTPPYFHDGSARTLAEAVRTMAKYNLGRKISDEQVEQIVKFLHTLTGEYQAQSLEQQ